jgi:hypothetical protein
MPPLRRVRWKVCILTAARSGEIFGARWPEFDLTQKVWTIPDTRMQLLARDLQRELEGLGGLHGEFSDTLRALAGPEPAWRRNLKVGSDRRSGERTLKSSVLGMAVRLYCEAHANPRFSIDGPLVRFANALGELVLGETNPFSPDAVRAEFRRMKPNARRLSSLQSLYAKTVKQRRWKTRRPIKRRGVHESEVDLS